MEADPVGTDRHSARIRWCTRSRWHCQRRPERDQPDGFRAAAEVTPEMKAAMPVVDSVGQAGAACAGTERETHHGR